MTRRRIRVAVLYGGRSTEHEISLLSARNVIEQLDRERYEVVPIAVDREGAWHAQDLDRLLAAPGPALPIATTTAPLSPAPRPTDAPLAAAAEGGIDVVFPVMHGPLCEDGALQGLLELSDLPYVGAGVLGSAVCMDKDVSKRLVASAGVAHTAYVSVRRGRWHRDPASVREAVCGELGFPVFVKPANLGSSIGITRVDDGSQLVQAIDFAFEYDTKVLVEQAVDAREIELAVLEAVEPDADPEVSLPGEVVAAESFYSFERKYVDDDGAELHIPADLEPGQRAEAQAIARRVFAALECEGMARVDLFLERESGRFLFNEANTIPGFTAISQYPKLWEASGLPYPDLLARLVDLALERHAERRQLRRIR
ncbi:MAG: D-alanine--D-alanine ligase family protein [Myxococcales bacterium]|jgi:D-alanine-D-alanine ligase